MSRKLFRVVTLGLVGYALVLPFAGCDSGGSQPKATIDTSTPIKAPTGPSGPANQKVEIKAKK